MNINLERFDPTDKVIYEPFLNPFLVHIASYSSIYSTVSVVYLFRCVAGHNGTSIAREEEERLFLFGNKLGIYTSYL